MMEPKAYLEMFFATRHPVAEKNKKLFEDFSSQEKYLEAVRQILSNQEMIMKDWKLLNRVDEIVNQHVLIPNASVGKPYQASLDFAKLGWEDIVAFEIILPEQSGLVYDKEQHTISGIPLLSGDHKLLFRFRLADEEYDELKHEKQIPLVVNPDPKSLWQDKLSDKEAPFWKPDNAADSAALGDKHIVVASKRGRSHANVGSFRDDDYAFASFAESGWNLVAVSDGAGSAKYSREGSRLACNGIIDYFKEQFSGEKFTLLDTLLPSLYHDQDADIKNEVNRFVVTELTVAARHIHKLLEEAAQKAEAMLSDFHATLIFTLIKENEFGYALLSFGVGDCPIAVLHNNKQSVTLMNTLDVGEFGGGTRFITMPEIFRDEHFEKRISFQLISDLDYLFMMSDGIYDPKFEVEANLSKIEKWQQFLADLNGDNPEGKRVVLNKENAELAQQLSDWMDFWSTGNHDDRTLAIVF